MKKRLLTFMMVFVMMAALVACGKSEKGGEDTSLSYIKEKGTFVLGLDDSFPPMGFRDDNNEIVGFDIDLAKAVCKKLGVTLVTQPIDWNAKEQELATKNIDCIWNGFSITDERKEQLAMTDAYLTNTIAVVVNDGSDIASLSDLSGKRAALQSGSAAEEALNAEEEKNLKDSLAEVNQFKDYITALMDLESGNSDAVLMDSVVAKYMINENGKKFVILDEYLTADEYGIGFRKGDDALRDEVWNALVELKADGTVAEIADKWFGEDITLIP
ncbi:MAG: amino acid ABC transporter substrate-binding protein [Lachnospiraceae bacterium]|nr:amino acid ABC transporter substrate-binding protein [Lachnospiraceae bacterium]